MENITEKESYDSESVDMELIGKWNNGFPLDDSRCLYETLYRANDDEYAIFSLWGPMSPYGEGTGNDYGISIKAITKNDAITWIMDHLSEQNGKENFPNAIQ